MMQDKYISIRIRNITGKQLRIISAIYGISQIEMLYRIVDAMYAHLIPEEKRKELLTTQLTTDEIEEIISQI